MPQVEIRYTRPERYTEVPPDLSAREGYYVSAATLEQALDHITIRHGSEVLDVEMKHGPYIGSYKRVEIHGPDERYIKLPLIYPQVSRLEQLLADVEGNVTIHHGVLTLEDGSQHELRGGK